jgi:hypothetical protein
MPKSSMNTIYMYIKIQSVNKIKHYYPIYRYKPSRKRDLPMKNTMYTIWVLGTKFVSYFNRIFTLWKWFTTQCRPYCKKIKQFFPHVVKAFGFVWGFFCGRTLLDVDAQRNLKLLPFRLSNFQNTLNSFTRFGSRLQCLILAHV